MKISTPNKQTKCAGALFINAPIPARIRLSDGKSLSTKRTLISAYELMQFSLPNSVEKSTILKELKIMIARVE